MGRQQSPPKICRCTVPFLVPSLWLLTLDADCRIFQNKTVKEIVEAVLKDHGITD